MSFDSSAPSRQVVTVLGPIDPATLTVTLSHDHLIQDAFALFRETTSSYA
jgi:predicted metal-dependent phosphotriesterase family hydrolase